MDNLCSAPTSPRLLSTQQVQDDQQIQIEAVDSFLMIFGTCMDILLLITVKIIFF